MSSIKGADKLDTLDVFRAEEDLYACIQSSIRSIIHVRYENRVSAFVWVTTPKSRILVPATW